MKNWKRESKENKKKIDSFRSIRPYTDKEVPRVVKRLFESFIFRKAFSKAIVKATEWDKTRVDKLIADILECETIYQFQKTFFTLISVLISRTSNGVTYTGLDKLSNREGYLFISNHRDITMDPVIINFLLDLNNHQTTYIGIGSNLMKIPYVRRFFRLQKCFTVKRNISSMRKLIDAMYLQSEFIFNARTNNESVWIAQREGRAKDGNDQTNRAVVRMLTYAGEERGMTFPEIIKKLRIVPVSISYEYDPCDVLKAKELFYKSNKGRDLKWKSDDMRSMAKGLFENKGRIHIHFGSPLEDHYKKRDDVAMELDIQVWKNYRIWPSNKIAFNLKYGRTDLISCDDHFLKHYNSASQELKPFLLEMYANPLINKNSIQKIWKK